jgi:hypothetical protein
MVLDWVPDATKRRTLPSATGSLSEAQEGRLQKALSLLDLQSRGSSAGSLRFGPHELREALKSAEDLMLTDAEIDVRRHRSHHARTRHCMLRALCSLRRVHSVCCRCC